MFKIFGIIVPLVLYFFVEAIFFAAVINTFWIYGGLSSKFTIELSYWNWVGIILGIKLIFLDVFKILSNISKLFTDAQTVSFVTKIRENQKDNTKDNE